MSGILLNGMPFDDYLEKYKIFEKTTQCMMRCLKNWYDDEPEDFQSFMRADYQTVAETYQFKPKPISLSLRLSSQVQRLMQENFFRRFPAQAFARAAIEQYRHSIHIILCHLSK